MTETKTISINAVPDDVFDYINDPSNWPEWAVHSVKNISRGEKDFWEVVTPRGPAKIRMHSDKRNGILDHEFIDADEVRWIIPARVVKASWRSHLVMTFTKPFKMPDEAFKIGMLLLEQELKELKRQVEIKMLTRKS